MKRYRITTGTITYALKGREILRRNGFKVHMERIQSGLANTGCGYSLVVTGEIEQAESLLRQAGVKVLEINEL